MAEESAPAPSESSGEGTSKGAAKAETSSSQPASPYEMPDEIQKKVSNYDQLNHRYLNDPHFQKIMDLAIQGKYDKVQVLDKLEAKNEASSNPDPDLREEIRALRAELGEVRGAQAYKDVSDYRNRQGESYYGAFEQIAEEHNYLPNTPGFKTLFEKAEKHGKLLAKKYGLVNDAGQPDPNLNFNKNLIKEAFDLADREMREIGFDPVKTRQEVQLKIRQQKEAQREKQLNDIFHPDNLKTTKGRADALRTGLRHVMLEKHGVDINDFKLAK